MSRNSRRHSTDHSNMSSMVIDESRSKIPTVGSCNRWRPSRPERGQSVRIEIQRKKEPVLKTSHGGYAVPKCCFINVCSLMKTRNKIKANIAVEADLYAADIDICVVSETHLKRLYPMLTSQPRTTQFTEEIGIGLEMTTGQRVELLCTLEILVISRLWMSSVPKLLSAFTLQCNCPQIIK